MAVQGTNCRAREAESLEQARQTDDEDLRSLYSTIAEQWRLLAEESETRHDKNPAPQAEVTDICKSSSDSDTKITEPGRIEDDPYRFDRVRDQGRPQFLEPDLSRDQISSRLENIARLIHQRSYDLALSSNAQHREGLHDIGAKNGQTGLDIDLVARGCERGGPGGDSAPSGQVGRNLRPSESPLEWILSGWFNARRR